LLRPSEIDRLVTAYVAGATLYELATVFQISRGTMSQHLKDRGTRLRLSPMTPSEIDEVISLYAQGLPMSEVADRVGRSTSLICLTLKRAGIRTRDSHGRPRTY
jgi:hypothetical protein